MYKKYGIFSFIIFILFIINRVYLQSKYVKTSYIHQKISDKIVEQEKQKSELIALLHELQSSTIIKKNVEKTLRLVPLTLQQIYSLPKDVILQ